MKFSLTLSLSICHPDEPVMWKEPFPSKSPKSYQDDEIWDVGLLASIYNLEHKIVGPAMMSAPYGDDKCQHPLASGYLMVLHEITGHFTKSYRDRLFMWHKGRTMVDIFNSDGTITSICLGDTLEDEDCRYVVTVPAEKICGFRTERHNVIFSDIVLGGTMKDHLLLSEQEAEDLMAKAGHLTPSHAPVPGSNTQIH